MRISFNFDKACVIAGRFGVADKTSPALERNQRKYLLSLWHIERRLSASQQAHTRRTSVIDSTEKSGQNTQEILEMNSIVLPHDAWASSDHLTNSITGFTNSLIQLFMPWSRRCLALWMLRTANKYHIFRFLVTEVLGK